METSETLLEAVAGDLDGDLDDSYSTYSVSSKASNGGREDSDDDNDIGDVLDALNEANDINDANDASDTNDINNGSGNNIEEGKQKIEDKTDKETDKDLHVEEVLNQGDGKGENEEEDSATQGSRVSEVIRLSSHVEAKIGINRVPFS